MEKEKNELLNFAFNEQDDKLKFYRSTLVQMTKEAYRKKPKELKTEEAVEEGELLTKAIMKKVDEFEIEKTNIWSPNYDPYYNMTTTFINHLGFEGNKQKVNPDFLNGTLGEHKEELQKLYQIKEQCGFDFIKDFANNKFPYSTTLSPIKEILGIDFIKDFIKACEKCED